MKEGFKSRGTALGLSAGAIFNFIKNREKIQKAMKTDAGRLAEFYEGALKIEINVSREKGVPKVNITEYNI